MATIAENLQNLTNNLVGVNNAKQAIKTAIESKGQDLTDIPFTGYADKITAIAGGKKFTTGTVTFATATATPVITHNLGVIPTTFIIYVTDETVIPESGTDEAKGDIWNGFANYFNVGDRTIINRFYAYQGNTSTGVYSWQPSPNVLSAGTTITETTITGGGTNTNYKFKPNHEYTWIAIE